MALIFVEQQPFFRDPNHLSMFDNEHSDNEDRWITMGLDNNGTLRVLVHTFEQISKVQANIRIISARKATAIEMTQYNQGIQL